MVRYQVQNIVLDGTNAVKAVLSTRMVSLGFVPASDTVTVNVKPSDQSDALPLTNGRTWLLEPVQPGQRIEPTVVTLTAASATTCRMVVGLD